MFFLFSPIQRAGYVQHHEAPHAFILKRVLSLDNCRDWPGDYYNTTAGQPLDITLAVKYDRERRGWVWSEEVI
jgi:hypothetical protein